MFATVWKPAAALGAASIGILWSVLAPAPVSAAPDLRAAFAEFDRNGDKAITLDEFLRRSVDTLYVMRADRPPAGHAKAMVVPLSKELVPPPAGARAAPEEMLRSEFARHDRDGDGSVRFEEFEAHHRAMIRAGFDAVDRNKDGSIDAGEFEAMTAAAPEEPAHATFDDLDGNKDGRISEDEFFG